MIFRGGEAPKDAIKISLYANGFTVADGPLRDYANNINETFMKELKEGHIPTEIIKKYGRDAHAAIENCL